MASERVHWLSCKPYLLLNHGPAHLQVHAADAAADASNPRPWYSGRFAYSEAVGVTANPPRLALKLRGSGYVLYDSCIVVFAKPGDTHRLFRTTATITLFQEDVRTIKETIPANTVVSLDLSSVREEEGRCFGILSGAASTPNARADPEAHHTSHLQGWVELNFLYEHMLQPHLTLRGTEWLFVNVFRRNEGVVPVREHPRLSAAVKWQLKPFRAVASSKFTICERGFLWLQVAKGNQLGWVIQHSGTDFATVLSLVDLTTVATTTEGTFKPRTSPSNTRTQEVLLDGVFVRNLFSKHALPARRHHDRKQAPLFDIHYRECLSCTKAVLTEDAELWLSVCDSASSRSMHTSDSWIAHHSLQTGELCVEVTVPEEERVLRPYLVAGASLALHRDPEGPVIGQLGQHSAFYGVSRRLDSGKRLWVQVVSRLDIATVPVNSCAYFSGWVEEHPASHASPPLQLLATDSGSFEGSVVREDTAESVVSPRSSPRSASVELAPLIAAGGSSPTTSLIPLAQTPAWDPLMQKLAPQRKQQQQSPQPRQPAARHAPVFMPGMAPPRPRNANGPSQPQASSRAPSQSPAISLPPQLQELLDRFVAGCRACVEACSQYWDQLYRQILELTIRRQYQGVQTAES